MHARVASGRRTANPRTIPTCLLPARARQWNNAVTMSGPITAGFVLVQGVLALSARALAEARAMKCEYAEVLAQLRERERAATEARRAQRSARLARIAASRAEAARGAHRFERLRLLAQTMAGSGADPRAELPAAPAQPTVDDDAAWAACVHGYEVAIREFERRLAQAGAAQGAQAGAALVAANEAADIDAVLGVWVRERSLRPGLDAATTERLRSTAARVLARLELPADAPLPREAAELARAIVLAPGVERAEALASELRLVVQRELERRAAQRVHGDEAQALLEALPGDAPAALVRALELVAAGAQPLDPDLREAARQALALGAAGREAAQDAAAALVLQESLRDLGYEVDDIEATLFAAGGAVHFRREGWDRYFVRLRVDAAESTVNFNVVRARGDEETAERRRLDALAEDRWCAEFPQLERTLAARGLALDVTRRLAAGALPVQVVDAGSLPALCAVPETARPGPALRARTPR
jgi:hypothetical protein